MALRLSDSDRLATARAAAIRAQNAAQNDYNNRMAAANSQYQQAAGRKINPLESVLSGIGNTIDNARKGLTSFFGTGGAAIGDLVDSIAQGKVVTDRQKGFKDWAKTNLMGDADLSDKDYYAKTGGLATDTASTLLDFIPGVGAAGKAAINIGQGALSGAAQQYIDKGASASLEDAIRGAAVGGAASGVGQYVGGKLANKVAGPGKLSQALNSNIGRGALTGAASGATGGGLNVALNGGDLGQVLSGAAQGAGGGALGGATMAGTMGLIGTGIEKLNNKVTGGGAQVDTPTADKITKRVKTPTAEAVDTVENIATPTKQAQRRKIAVTDYDAGEQNVRVRRPDTEYSLGRRQGSNIDGILGPDNARKLPNAEVNTVDQFNRLFGDDTADVADAIRRGYFDVEGDDALSQKGVFRENLSKDAYEALKNGTRDYADFMNDVETVTGGAASAKSNLPKIRTSDYIEATGYKGKDIPDYMRPFLSEDGVPLKNSDWAEVIPKYNNGGQFTGTPDDILNFYETLANTNNGVKYTNENAAGALGMNNALNDRVNKEFLESNYPTRKIDVDKAPTIAENIDVESYGNTAPRKNILGQQTQNVAREKQRPTYLADEQVDLIRKGTPEYNEMVKQDRIANTKRELRQTIVDGVRDQYGTTRLNDRINGLNDAILDVATLGLTDRADIDGFVGRITGAEGEVPKIIRKSLKDAGNVQAETARTMQDIYEAVGADTTAQKRAKSFIDAKTKKYHSKNGEMNRLDMYDLGKELEKEGYKMVDRGDRTQSDSTRSYGDALIELSRDMIDQATEGVDIRGNINVNKLKNILPDNEDWAARVDEFAQKANTVQDARNFIASPTKLALLAQAEEYNQGTYGQRMGDMGKDASKIIKAGTSANPATAGAQIIATKYAESKANKQRILKNNLQKLKNVEKTGEVKTNNATGKIMDNIRSAASKVGDKIGKATSALNNDTFSGARLGGDVGEAYNMPSFGDLATRQIARQSGLAQMRNQDAEAAMQSAAQEAQNAQTDYENALSQAEQNYNNAVAQTQSKGAETLDRISSAMDMAIAAGNIDAYSQLANLYKQAYSIYEAQNPTSASNTSSKALNATQAKAVTGLSQLQQLANMQPSMRTALANSPLGGLVDITGGDTYNSQADSLASTIGYLLSGANIKDNEIAAVKRDYVPSTFDSPQVRREKLSRAEQLLRNYLSDTGALTSL